MTDENHDLSNVPRDDASSPKASVRFDQREQFYNYINRFVETLDSQTDDSDETGEEEDSFDTTSGEEEDESRQDDEENGGSGELSDEMANKVATAPMECKGLGLGGKQLRMAESIVHAAEQPAPLGEAPNYEEDCQLRKF